MAKSQEEYTKCVTKFTETKEQFEQKTKEVQKLEELLETLTVGMAASEGQDNGYQDQLKGNYISIFDVKQI
jgi:hypothetical protein